MSLTNTLTGVNLTTLATGVVIPIQSNTLAYVAPQTFYTQIGTCTTANNNYSLPINPIPGQTYTIRNDGATPAYISAGSTTSTLNGVATANGSIGGFSLAQNGGVASFIALSNNGAANTAATTAAANNPLVVWQSSQEWSNDNIWIATTVTAFTANATQSGGVFMLPSSGAIITLPAVATSTGLNFKFIMRANNATNAWVLTPPAGTLIGNVIMAATTVAGVMLALSANTVSFTTTSLKGDWVDVYCDGVSWFARGNGCAAASFATA